MRVVLGVLLFARSLQELCRVLQDKYRPSDMTSYSVFEYYLGCIYISTSSNPDKRHSLPKRPIFASENVVILLNNRLFPFGLCQQHETCVGESPHKHIIFVHAICQLARLREKGPDIYTGDGLFRSIHVKWLPRSLEEMPRP